MTTTDADRRWLDLGAFIREQRRSGQLSLRRLSEMSGISNPYLSQIERGLRRPSADILQQIARSLEISAETLYIRAGILEERDQEHDLVGEIRRDPILREDQKKTLLHIYESFRLEAQRERDELAAERAAEDEAAGSESQPEIVDRAGGESAAGSKR